MRKLMVAVCFALLAGGTVQAQNGSEAPRRGWNPEMVAKRMSERLMLGEEASAKFIPLYQEYMQKLAECRMPRRQGGQEAAQTDEAIDERIQQMFDAQEKRLKVQKDYYGKFKEVLTMRQVEQLYNRAQAPGRNRPQGAPRAPRGMNR